MRKKSTLISGLVALCLSTSCVETKKNGDILCLKYWGGRTCAREEGQYHRYREICYNHNKTKILNGTEKYPGFKEWNEGIKALRECDKLFDD